MSRWTRPQSCPGSWLFGVGALLALVSCSASSPRVLGEKFYSNDPGAAAVFAGAGVVLYAVDGGCKKAGCPSDLRCNYNTERCERVRCTKLDAPQVCGSTSLCSTRTSTCVSF